MLKPLYKLLRQGQLVQGEIHLKVLRGHHPVHCRSFSPFLMPHRQRGQAEAGGDMDQSYFWSLHVQGVSRRSGECIPD